MQCGVRAYDATCCFAPLKMTTPLPSGTFTLGSTVPLKCTAKDVDGAIVSTATMSAAAWLSSTTEPSTDTAIDAGSANGDTTFFRYDAIGQQYVFNWSTKGLVTGTYSVRATVDDGSVRYATTYLK